jgi:hypothetical protein
MNGPFYRSKTDLERRPFLGYIFWGGRMKKFLLWVLLALAATPATLNATPLPFIQDDFAKAHSQAMRRKLPIFVECWAPW